MSFFCSDHHLFIAGAPRVIACSHCGSYCYEAASAGGNACPACAPRSDDNSAPPSPADREKEE